MNARTESRIGHASDNDLRIALHYQEAAELLYKSGAYQDGLALPFLFLVRQFLELGLKYNIKRLSEVSKCRDGITSLSNIHDLREIHRHFLTHYKKAKENQGISKVGEQKYLDTLASLVEKIAPLDHGSQGFRYATNKDGQKIIARHETYNLKEVSDLLEDCSSFFSSIEDVFGLNLE